MKEPTQEEIKKLWEWCGWRQVPEGKKAFHYERCQKVMNWYAPDNQERSYKSLPEIDLNNLFKYAVPNLYGCKLCWKGVGRGMQWLADIELYEANAEFQTSNEEYDDDPALALFWAIYKVIKK